MAEAVLKYKKSLAHWPAHILNKKIQTRHVCSSGLLNPLDYSSHVSLILTLLYQQNATRLVWERMKLLIEPTAGVAVAAVLSQHFQTVSPEVKNICVVLSGGNVDFTSLTWMKQAERPVNQSVSV